MTKDSPVSASTYLTVMGAAVAAKTYGRTTTKLLPSEAAVMK
ncbi:hypothetical protein Lp90_0826 [Lactiplantibacillus plantarum]|nr:hypothetical protein Lp90_0826 [Lactiplantibacillus plantarum]KTF01121.1 hypothetical protein SF2A35B_2308 [Lactiplantibacillus plantarum]